MGKKLVFYLKNASRAITITDHKENRSMSDIKKEVADLIAGVGVCYWESGNDCLILKANEILGVYVEETGKVKKEESDLVIDDLEGNDFSLSSFDSDIDYEEGENIDKKLTNHLREIELEEKEEISPEVETISIVDNRDIDLVGVATPDISLDGLDDGDDELMLPPDVSIKQIKLPVDSSKSEVVQQAQQRMNVTVKQEPRTPVVDFPEHMLAVAESSEEVDAGSVNSPMLSQMGVVQKKVDPNAPKPGMTPQNVPRVGEKKTSDILNRVQKSAKKNNVKIQPVSLRRDQ
jgi:hypothetical protein